MKETSWRELKAEEGRQRMADLRARKSRRAALAFDRKFGLVDGSKWRITNLRQVMEAMAEMR